MSARNWSTAGVVALVPLFGPTAAQAGILSMQFAGGGNEVTLGPMQGAVIEVLFQMNSTDGPANRLTGFDTRFDVGTLVPGVGGSYVVNDPPRMQVIGWSDLYPGWSGSTAPTPEIFDGSFFFTYGDPDGLVGPVGDHTEQAPVGLASFSIWHYPTYVGDVSVVFRIAEPLPALYNGPVAWQNRWGYDTLTGGQQFLIGQGNPGDADPTYAYHGYETIQPLTIHLVPEPGTWWLLALGAAGAMATGGRHRRNCSLSL